MRDKKMDDLERISALVDGQLAADECTELVSAIGASDDARAAWHAYHVIGDALRGGSLLDCSDDRVFVARLRKRLAEQPPSPAVFVLAPVISPPIQQPGMATGSIDARHQGVPAANDAVVRWKWLAAAASMAAVAVLGWNVTWPGTDADAQLAGGPQLPQQTVVARSASGPEPVMMRDPRLDELLEAHRQYGAASALPVSAGFLRNATFEQHAR